MCSQVEFIYINDYTSCPCENDTDGFHPLIQPNDKESSGLAHAMVNHAEERLG